MPDAWFSLSPTEMGWVILAAFLAGLVRGFTGFGSGLVFLPVAAQGSCKNSSNPQPNVHSGLSHV